MSKKATRKETAEIFLQKLEAEVLEKNQNLKKNLGMLPQNVLLETIHLKSSLEQIQLQEDLVNVARQYYMTEMYGSSRGLHNLELQEEQGIRQAGYELFKKYGAKAYLSLNDYNYTGDEVCLTRNDFLELIFRCGFMDGHLNELLFPEIKLHCSQWVSNEYTLLYAYLQNPHISEIKPSVVHDMIKAGSAVSLRLGSRKQTSLHLLLNRFIHEAAVLEVKSEVEEAIFDSDDSSEHLLTRFNLRNQRLQDHEQQFPMEKVESQKQIAKLIISNAPPSLSASSSEPDFLFLEDIEGAIPFFYCKYDEILEALMEIDPRQIDYRSSVVSSRLFASRAITNMGSLLSSHKPQKKRAISIMKPVSALKVVAEEEQLLKEKTSNRTLKSNNHQEIAGLRYWDFSIHTFYSKGPYFSLFFEFTRQETTLAQKYLETIFEVPQAADFIMSRISEQPEFLADYCRYMNWRLLFKLNSIGGASAIRAAKSLDQELQCLKCISQQQIVEFVQQTGAVVAKEEAEDSGSIMDLRRVEKLELFARAGFYKATFLEEILSVKQFKSSTFLSFKKASSCLMHYFAMHNLQQGLEACVTRCGFNVDQKCKRIDIPYFVYYQNAENPEPEEYHDDNEVYITLMDCTPLHVAVASGNYEATKTLILHQANVYTNVMAKSGRSLRTKYESLLALATPYPKLLHLLEISILKFTEDRPTEQARHEISLSHKQFYLQPDKPNMTNDLERFIKDEVQQKWSVTLTQFIKYLIDMASIVINFVFIIMNFVNRPTAATGESYYLFKLMVVWTEFILVLIFSLMLIVAIILFNPIRLTVMYNTIMCRKALGKCLGFARKNHISWILFHSNSKRIALMLQLVALMKLSVVKFFFNFGLLSIMLEWTLQFLKERFAGLTKSLKTSKNKCESLLRIASCFLAIIVSLGIIYTVFAYLVFVGSVAVLVKLKQVHFVFDTDYMKWSILQWYTFISLLNQLAASKLLVYPDLMTRFKIIGDGFSHVQELFYLALIHKSLHLTPMNSLIKSLEEKITALRRKKDKKYSCCKSCCLSILESIQLGLKAVRHTVNTCVSLISSFFTFYILAVYAEASKLESLTKKIMHFKTEHQLKIIQDYEVDLLKTTRTHKKTIDKEE